MTDSTSNSLIQRESCRALVITCSDFRFKTTEHEFEASLGLVDDHDLIARPGSIRSLVAPRSAAAEVTMAEEIRLLWTLHNFQRIIAVNHLSCRAYDAILAGRDERDVHVEHLRRAKQILDGYFAGASTEIYLAQPDGDRIAVIPIE